MAPSCLHGINTAHTIFYSGFTQQIDPRWEVRLAPLLGQADAAFPANSLGNDRDVFHRAGAVVGCAVVLSAATQRAGSMSPPCCCCYFSLANERKINRMFSFTSSLRVVLQTHFEFPFGTPSTPQLWNVEEDSCPSWGVSSALGLGVVKHEILFPGSEKLGHRNLCKLLAWKWE